MVGCRRRVDDGVQHAWSREYMRRVCSAGVNATVCCRDACARFRCVSRCFVDVGVVAGGCGHGGFIGATTCNDVVSDNLRHAASQLARGGVGVGRALGVLLADVCVPVWCRAPAARPARPAFAQGWWARLSRRATSRRRWKEDTRGELN